MEITRIQIRAPKGSDGGKVVERPFKVIGDTVFLCDESGKPLLDDDDQKYSRKLLSGDVPKQVASVLLRQHYSRVQTGPRDFNRRINYPPLKY